MKVKAGLILCWILAALLFGCESRPVGDVESLPKITRTIELTIGGSGTNLPLIQKLASLYMDKNPEVKVSVPDSVGSAYGIKNAASGLFDIGLVSRPLKEKEQQYGLNYVPYASTVIVFAAHPSVGVTDLSSDQLVDIYKGRITNWKQVGGSNQPIVVLDREPADSSRAVLDKELPGFREYDKGKKYEGIITFTTDQTMNEAISSIDNSIGWTDLGAIKTEPMNVRIIHLDGVVPGYNSVNKGKYNLVKELAFVVRTQVSGPAGNFLDFVKSNEAYQVMLQNGYFPVIARESQTEN